MFRAGSRFLPGFPKGSIRVFRSFGLGLGILGFRLQGFRAGLGL